MKITWEIIEQENHIDSLYRSRVPGGWLVKMSNNVETPFGPPSEGQTRNGYELRESITFVPDPLNIWK